MSALQKIQDWLYATYDFAFINNNRVDWFRWHQDTAGVPETQEQILLALRLLSQIWTPDTLTVTIDSFTYGVPDGDEEEVEVPVSIEAPHLAVETLVNEVEKIVTRKQNILSNTQHGLSSIGPSIQGWVRIAIPEGANLSEEWILACSDGIIPREYQIRSAPDLNGLKTIWLKLSDVNSSSDLSIFVRAVGQIEARLTLGLTAFNPENDPRPTSTLLHNVPLGVWQEVNALLLKAVFSELELAGYLS